MNRHHRDDKSGRDVGLIGERTEKVSGYDTKAWHPVDKMLKGDHPTTHMGTVACAGGHMGSHHKMKDGGHVMSEQRKMVEGRGMSGDKMKKGGRAKMHFAAGGVGKERKGQY